MVRRARTEVHDSMQPCATSCAGFDWPAAAVLPPSGSVYLSIRRRMAAAQVVTTSTGAKREAFALSENSKRSRYVFC